MRRPDLSLIVAVSLLGVVTSAIGQAVPRAVPVEDEEVQKPIPRAIPVNPNEVPPAPPKPKGPDQDLFDYASMVYERGEYAIAVQSFGEYLQNYPSGSQVPLALFRIAECYMKQNQLKVAETYYQEVVSRYPNSEGAPSAAYRLGAMRFNAKDFEESARQFAFCETKSTLPQVRLAASYNKARAYQMLGDTARQVAALQTVISTKTDNPYREAALLTLGTVLLAQDKKAEALPLFQDLLKESKDNAVLSEASVKAAVLLAETGKPDEAIPLFERALAIPETSPLNRGIALVGVVQALFAKGNYDGVIDNYNRNSGVLPEGETRPKMLLLVGNAYRMKKAYARAVEVYLMIEQGYPGSDQAFEAGYWKLYCFYLLDDKDLGEFAAAFIQKHLQDRAQHEFLNLARLIRADFYFNKGDYANAANSYSDVQIDKLPVKLQPGTLFNKGWALAEAGRHQDAISAFSQFLAQFPAHEFTAKALARRGLAYRSAKDIVKAVADFQRVVKEYTNSDAAEVAYLQLGLIAMEQRDSKAMIAAFEMLVKKYPRSQAAGQAWYGIGRGYFDLKDWEKAVPALEKAIEVDKTANLDRASQMLMLAHYAQQNVDGLSQAIDNYRKANENAVIPPNVVSWLGLKLYDMKLYARSTKYLSLATTPDAPENTDPRVWNYLGMAFLETKDYEASIKAIDHFLKVTPESAVKARGLMTKGRALLGLGKIQEAEKVAQEGLGFAKDGKPQALLLILEGDIAMAAGNELEKAGDASGALEKYKAAAGKFMYPAQFFDDGEVTPEAMDKAAKALEKAGQAEKAGDFRKSLKDRYPSYKAEN
ncbi:Tetratricopeptide repeat-containing protein [Prosthecobacter debontii]|uniref:Tetratricopeptide repeat-containing protein n=1 Tax=Prosthecobacter debontii TaxID=48467 RepID=A0A1T4YLY3_9BACT|nr:tetratricopeptide repeat protein [Prosthecobacter debontii]SKB02285.1 Tetratricopeptide repeat-containing protein [Prosthecobacter debontii]